MVRIISILFPICIITSLRSDVALSIATEQDDLNARYTPKETYYLDQTHTLASSYSKFQFPRIDYP